MVFQLTPFPKTIGSHALAMPNTLTRIIEMLFNGLCLPWSKSLKDVLGSSAGSCDPASCPTYKLGVSGFGASFDDVNDFVSLPGPLLMGLYNTSFTFMAWIRVNSFTPNGDNAILASNGITTAGLSLHCVIRRGLLYFGFNNNDFGSTFFSSYWFIDACRFPLLRFKSSSKYRNEPCFFQTSTGNDPCYLGTFDLSLG
jgi:hypothetical protein